MAKNKYIVTLLHKVAPEERDVYRANADPKDFEDMYASESRDIGEPAVYAQWLTDEAVEAFESASNVNHVEKAQQTKKLGTRVSTEDDGREGKEIDEGVARYGVEKAVLDYHGFTDASGPTGDGVIVGVGDTGFNGQYEYIEQRVVGLWNFTNSPDAFDKDGHGTWCCGAALPYASTLVSGKTLGDDGRGWNTWTMAFIRRFTDFCRLQGRKGVISLSLGGGGYSQAYEDAARYATERGIPVIAASGNDGWLDHISSPANSPSVFAVGAVSHHDGSIASFSNRDKSPAEPNIYAAGMRVLGQGEGRWSGTSMATPLVARAAARAMSVGGASVGEVKLNLVASSRDKERYDGHGILSVARLMRRMAA
jgi:cell wall-associated protease